ncbi:hypothetical protein SSX86_008129 [Deinandra increscens subsp. villosa]|uniref:Integrase catalytic domain-containing protein n=1 Tax=Deinandra increscens subsp. villosa TaxID=3103831 RepID=A0AAP0H6J2_9ASTR
MDILTQLAMVPVRAQRFYKRTGRTYKGAKGAHIGLDKSKVKCYNRHQLGHFARECPQPRREGQNQGQTLMKNHGGNNHNNLSNNSAHSSGQQSTQPKPAGSQNHQNVVATVANQTECVELGDFLAEFEPINHALMAKQDSASDHSSIEKYVETKKPEVTNASTSTSVDQSKILKPSIAVPPPTIYESKDSKVGGKQPEQPKGSQTQRLGKNNILENTKRINGGPVAFGSTKGHISTQGDVSNGLAIVLKLGVKIPDELIVLKAPRRDGLYILDMSVAAPSCGTACFISKASLEESGLWHRRYTWVFFLKTKDEAAELLKTLVINLENQSNLKVKTIRCDNGTELKNHVLNSFCEEKGIVRQFSAPRTPQQNGVAERRNRTLIEAARILIIKGKNKTPYELWRKRKPNIYFFKPFGCPVTILRTNELLPKLAENADEGYFVGYCGVSKAYRVYNKRTKIVEETINVSFNEKSPYNFESHPTWLFDIDALTTAFNITVEKPVSSSVPSGTRFSGSSSTANSISETVENTYSGSSEPENSNVAASNELSFEHLTHNSETSSHEAVEVSDPMSHFGDVELEHILPRLNIPSNGRSHEFPMLQDRRINKNHPLDNVIGDMSAPVLTRSKSADANICLHAAFFVSRMQGYVQEEGIDYDGVFAPMARLEAIRIFLAYDAFKDFQVFQMDIRSAYLYGLLEQEVYVKQPPGFEDPHYPNRICKLIKALYGLKQAPRTCARSKLVFLHQLLRLNTLLPQAAAINFFGSKIKCLIMGSPSWKLQSLQTTTVPSPTSTFITANGMMNFD